MGPWWWYEQKGERAAQMWNVPNMERRNVPFWEGAQNGICPDLPWRAVVMKAGALVVPRTSHAAGVKVVLHII